MESKRIEFKLNASNILREFDEIISSKDIQESPIFNQCFGAIQVLSHIIMSDIIVKNNSSDFTEETKERLLKVFGINSSEELFIFSNELGKNVISFCFKIVNAFSDSLDEFLKGQKEGESIH